MQCCTAILRIQYQFTQPHVVTTPKFYTLSLHSPKQYRLGQGELLSQYPQFLLDSSLNTHPGLTRMLRLHSFWLLLTRLFSLVFSCYFIQLHAYSCIMLFTILVTSITIWLNYYVAVYMFVFVYSEDDLAHPPPLLWESGSCSITNPLFIPYGGSQCNVIAIIIANISI